MHAAILDIIMAQNFLSSFHALPAHEAEWWTFCVSKINEDGCTDFEAMKSLLSKSAQAFRIDACLVVED